MALMLSCQSCPWKVIWVHVGSASRSLLDVVGKKSGPAARTESAVLGVSLGFIVVFLGMLRHYVKKYEAEMTQSAPHPPVPEPQGPRIGVSGGSGAVELVVREEQLLTKPL
jgi:hypothetical protein